MISQDGHQPETAAPSDRGSSDSAEQAAPFHNAPDVPAYFSDEEWKLLHEWQKELYRNVMKEIHQALSSLGPLIATTVCSLRAKEKQELRPLTNQDCERKHRVNNAPTGDMIADPDCLFKINNEGQLHLNSLQDSEGRERSDSPSTGFPFLNTDMCSKKEEPASIFIDHLGAEMGECSSDSNSGYEIVSFRIKNEEETYFTDKQNSSKRRSIKSPSGDVRITRRKEVGESIKCSKIKPPSKAPAWKTHTKVLQSSHKAINSGSQPWLESCQEQGGEKTTQCENASNDSHLIVYPEMHTGGISQECNEFGSGLINSQMLNGLHTTPRNQPSYTLTKCDKSYSLKEELIRPKRAHTRARPYVCTNCGKSFLHKVNLINHYRTHTGEKPYACTFCDKSFSRKDYLNAHIRTHTGERPYKCTECEKSFTQKGEFNQHRRKHT